MGLMTGGGANVDADAFRVPDMNEAVARGMVAGAKLKTLQDDGLLSQFYRDHPDATPEQRLAFARQNLSPGAADQELDRISAETEVRSHREKLLATRREHALELAKKLAVQVAAVPDGPNATQQRIGIIRSARDAIGQFGDPDMARAIGEPTEEHVNNLLGLRRAMGLQTPEEERNAKYQDIYSEARAKAEAEEPSRVRLENAKLRNDILQDNRRTGNDIRLERIKSAMKGGEPKALTESQGNAAGFGLRATDADRTIQDMMSGGEYDPTGWRARSDAAMGWAGLNSARSGAGQKYGAVAENFVRAVLRKESGASISPSEMEGAERMWIPAPGDGPEVIAQKQRNREQAIESLKYQAGPSGIPEFRPGSQADPLADEVARVYPDAPEGKRVKHKSGSIYIKSGGRWVRQ